ncbi:MAG: hypothetical protein AAB425_09545, partial [Bdellovibrionota bacterium]
LRNFKTGPDFLETWVHDEDPNVSIFGILEAANCANVTSLRLRIGPNSMAKINRTRLNSEIAKIGTATWIPEGKAFSLIYRSKAAVSDAVTQPYQAAVSQALKNIRFEGAIQSTPANSAPDTVRVEVTEGAGGSGRLNVVTTAKGIVLEARHSGFKGDVRALMDVYCAEMMGRSVQEASDHTGIRVEHKLRNPAFPREKNGVITPDNANGLFVLPQKMVRDLFSKFLHSTKKTMERNFWRDAISDSWLKLSHEERVRRVQAALLQACRELRLQVEMVEVVGIKNDVRMILSCQQDPTKPDLGSHLIKIEQILRQRLDPGIDLLLESREDRNKRKDRMLKLAGGIAPGQPATARSAND